MGLVKRPDAEAPPSPTGEQKERRRRPLRGPGGLLDQLESHDPQIRRWAVRDLSAFPEVVDTLCAHLHKEGNEQVREAIFTTFSVLGGEEVIHCLLPLLRSEDPSLRNMAIEVLQRLPRELESHMSSLLKDDDPDVRGFAIDILTGVGHSHAREWIAKVLETEENHNILGKGIECLTEIGTREEIPGLERCARRFPDDPFIQFAVETAVRRIRASFDQEG